MLGLLCSCILVVATIWPILLFPSVSVSSGELKCRGMYVDEHAFSAQVLPAAVKAVPLLDSFGVSSLEPGAEAVPRAPNNTLQKEATENVESVASNFDELCAQLMLFGASICSVRTDPAGAVLVEIVVDSPNKPQSLEVIAVPIIFDSTSQDLAFGLSQHLVRDLVSSAWLSRRVVVLALREEALCTSGGCNNASSYSDALDRWITDKHSADGSLGLLREAFSFDVRSVGPDCYSVKPKPWKYVTREVGEPYEFSTFYELRVVGSAGQLPNMDLISTALTLLPYPVLQLYSSQRHSLLTYLEFTLKKFLPAEDLEMHFYRLNGLFNFWLAQLHGSDGPHSCFLRRDIDAVTLVPAPPRPSPAVSKQAADVSVKDTTEALLLLIRASSQLHEELHHSHFFYLLMGEHSFVGQGEMALLMSLALFPLLIMYLRFAAPPFYSHIGFKAAGAVLIDVILPMGPIFVPSQGKAKWVTTCALFVVSVAIAVYQVRAIETRAPNAAYQEESGTNQACVAEKYVTYMKAYGCMLCAVLLLGGIHAAGHLFVLGLPLAIFSSGVVTFSLSCFVSKAKTKFGWIRRVIVSVLVGICSPPSVLFMSSTLTDGWLWGAPHSGAPILMIYLLAVANLLSLASLRSILTHSS